MYLGSCRTFRKSLEVEYSLCAYGFNIVTNEKQGLFGRENVCFVFSRNQLPNLGGRLRCAFRGHYSAGHIRLDKSGDPYRWGLKIDLSVKYMILLMTRIDSY